MSQKFLQEDGSPKNENTHSEAFNEVTTQTETRQRSNSNSRAQGLFKVSVLVHSARKPAEFIKSGD